VACVGAVAAAVSDWDHADIEDAWATLRALAQNTAGPKQLRCRACASCSPAGGLGGQGRLLDQADHRGLSRRSLGP